MAANVFTDFSGVYMKLCCACGDHIDAGKLCAVCEPLEAPAPAPVAPVTYTLGLAPLDSTDMPLVRSWRNDYRIWQWCRQNDFISDAQQSRWFDRQSSDASIKMYKVLVLTPDTEKAVPVGVCGFSSIDMTNRNAEFSIYIAPTLHGNGFGKQALTCLLNHGFKNLGLNVIWGEVFVGNPAIEKFRALGFVDEGVRRGFYFRDGKFVDAHLISLRAEEWTR